MKATIYPYNPNTNKNPHYLPWHAHITALTVAPALRRMGHARKLTEILEQQGDAKDAWFVDLYVRVDNKVAIRLYESMGYVHKCLLARIFSVADARNQLFDLSTCGGLLSRRYRRF